MHKKDIEETIKLTKAYIAQPCRYEEIYGFTRNDIRYLVSSSSSKPIKETKKNCQGSMLLNKMVMIPKKHITQIEVICFCLKKELSSLLRTKMERFNVDAAKKVFQELLAI